MQLLLYFDASDDGPDACVDSRPMSLFCRVGTIACAKPREGGHCKRTYRVSTCNLQLFFQYVILAYGCASSCVGLSSNDEYWMP